ncbi:hypothetical protein OAO87_00245 [bacterium]|nr:hypothetical protein [bacterium]
MEPRAGGVVCLSRVGRMGGCPRVVGPDGATCGKERCRSVLDPKTQRWVRTYCATCAEVVAPGAPTNLTARKLNAELDAAEPRPEKNRGGASPSAPTAAAPLPSVALRLRGTPEAAPAMPPPAIVDGDDKAKPGDRRALAVGPAAETAAAAPSEPLHTNAAMIAAAAAEHCAPFLRDRGVPEEVTLDLLTHAIEHIYLHISLVI